MVKNEGKMFFFIVSFHFRIAASSSWTPERYTTQSHVKKEALKLKIVSHRRDKGCHRRKRQMVADRGAAVVNFGETNETTRVKREITLVIDKLTRSRGGSLGSSGGEGCYDGGGVIPRREALRHRKGCEGGHCDVGIWRGGHYDAWFRWRRDALRMLGGIGARR
ncbi:hypothetical protein L484_014303 [Morus notabilis]|uniref:Uncharacterized protein n=1 Tax=Morus notabilis TaxID=981085 RepID=W9RBT8_9ROSA|nr:hypothetical protein L484_014303 [Morus notabilis]